MTELDGIESSSYVRMPLRTDQSNELPNSQTEIGRVSPLEPLSDCVVALMRRSGTSRDNITIIIIIREQRMHTATVYEPLVWA